MDNSGGDIVRFGSFELDLSRRTLHSGAAEVRLGSRSLELLIALIERQGAIVSQGELTSLVWPDTTVDESSLRVAISGLRKALGEGEDTIRHIVNEHGRGYRFVTKLQNLPVDDVQFGPVSAMARTRIGRVIGRESVIETIDRALDQRRLVSIVGPGGIGKSTVALSIAELRAGRYDDGVRFIDLALVADPAALGAHVSSSIGLRSTVTSAVDLAAALRARSALLVFDNCEHLVGAVAELVEAVLSRAPSVHILATSREALGVPGERVCRLPGMALPPEGQALPASAVLRFASVELFVERARAASPNFSFGDADAPVVAELCRRLDGIPLAIELAAARVDFFGLRELAARLDDRFVLLTDGHRTALPHHQTLLATLDWSYDTLTHDERTVLSRLGAFRGAFTLASATAVAGDDGLSPDLVVECMSGLVAKSLVGANVSREVATYRLLETTRHYALLKLVSDPKRGDVLRRHALHCIELLEGASADLIRLGRQAWMDRYAGLVGDVRAALDWTFSQTGDAAIGVRLTAVSAPFGDQLSLHDEYLQRIMEALERVKAGDPNHRRESLGLNFWLSNLLLQGPGDLAGFQAAAKRGAELEDETGEVPPGAIMAEWTSALITGDYPASRASAARLEAMAVMRGDAELETLASRITAQTLLHLGEFDEAERRARAVLESPFEYLPLSSVGHHVSMRIVLARIACLRGEGDLGERLISEALAKSHADNAMALAQVICLGAVPLAIWSDREAAARSHLQALFEVVSRSNLNYWEVWGRQLERAVDLKWGSTDVLVANAHEDEAVTACNLVDMLPTFDPRFLTRRATDRVSSGLVGWCAPEILRAEALRCQHQSPEKAARLALEALDRARAMGAGRWVSRAAQTLADLRRGTMRRERATN